MWWQGAQLTKHGDKANPDDETEKREETKTLKLKVKVSMREENHVKIMCPLCSIHKRHPVC